MKEVLSFEWYKFWRKKTSLLSFLSVPLVITLGYKFLYESNKTVEMTNASYGTNISFPYLILQENLVLIINVLIVLYGASTVTEELKKGELRMTFTRGVSKVRLLLSKFLVLSVVIAIFFILCLLISTIIGNMYMPKADSMYLFFTGEKLGIHGALIYTIKYYMLSYFTTISFLAVIIFVSTISANSATATCLGIFLIIFNLIYPELALQLIGVKNIASYVAFSSLAYIQNKGIAIMLTYGLNPYFIGVMLFYVVFFLASAILCLKNENYLY